MMNEQNKPKQKKCSQFSFQKLNKYFLFPFFIPIICFSTKFFSETMKTDNNKKKIEEVTIDNTHTFVFMYQIIQSICLILGGLLYFITLYKSKSKSKITNEIDTDKNGSVDSGSVRNSKNDILEKYLKRNIEDVRKKDWKKF